MSASELEAAFASQASALAGLVEEATDRGLVGEIPDENLGQLLASLVRLYAAKVQAGGRPRPFGANSALAVTDVAIGCTAMMDAVGLEVFELGAWQAMSGLGKIHR
ncbi:hypothetical protein ABGN05_06355 [Aquibium sp. LZ166]|uniref:Uncharacterized protein n=1 Tax=Aquibium pacificus TaxID=3153579 RepID=A0ABV3SEZ1_9HYPH